MIDDEFLVSNFAWFSFDKKLLRNIMKYLVICLRFGLTYTTVSFDSFVNIETMSISGGSDGFYAMVKQLSKNQVEA